MGLDCRRQSARRQIETGAYGRNVVWLGSKSSKPRLSGYRTMIHSEGCYVPSMSCKADQEPYRSERLLVDHFCELLESGGSPWGKLHVAREFDYRRGRADIVAVDSRGDVIAFEAKLRQWKHAMHQAYRNRCFAHRSYVVLPSDTARNAQRQGAEFERRSVGLCHPDRTTVVVALPSARQTPIQPWLSRVASTKVRESKFDVDQEQTAGDHSIDM